MKIKANIIELYRYVKFRISVLKNYLHDWFNWKGASPRLDEILWISPKSITGFILIGKTYHLSNRGTIRSGDWDLEVRPLKERERLDILTRMFQEGKGSDPERQLRDFLSRQGFSKKQCNFWVDHAWHLYESIMKHGFILKKVAFIEKFFRDKSSVRVAITRSGDFVWVGSHHRMAAALALQLEKMPVKVMWRHYEWQSKRRDFYNSIRKGEISSEDISHPDLKVFSRII